MEQRPILLLVEDEHLIADTLTMALEDAGFSVLAATKGAMALSCLDTQVDEIVGIITDVRLEDNIEGWEVARRARELKPDMPIVYMTGDSAADWPVQGVPESILLQKPFAPEQLIAAIASLLNARDSKLSKSGPAAQPPK